MTRRTRPRQALSARQLDRVQGEVKALLAYLERTFPPICADVRCEGVCAVHRRLTRLLRRLERGETR